jgi:hypothetical protein
MRKPLAIAVMTLLGTAAFAAGEVYRWKDANGVWHYSDQNHPGAELVRTSGAPSTASAPPAQAAATQTPAQPAPTTNEQLPVSKEVAQEVKQEAAAAKAKRCEKAKTDYEQMVQALRIKTKDAKGNEVFMDAAGMDKARLDARAIRDLACAP